MNSIHRLYLDTEQAEVARRADVAQWDEAQEVGNEEALTLVTLAVVGPCLKETTVLI